MRLINKKALEKLKRKNRGNVPLTKEIDKLIDDIEQNKWAGEISWSQSSFPISAGEHTISWKFIKDQAVSNGNDAVWIDNIIFPPTFYNSILYGDVNSDGNIHIDDDKYIVNIKCELWDKSLEVTESLTLFKDEYSEEITELTNYNIKSLSDAYTYYVLYKKDGLVISKHYFDKVAKDIMSEFLDSDGLINNSWFINVS